MTLAKCFERLLASHLLLLRIHTTRYGSILHICFSLWRRPEADDTLKKTSSRFIPLTRFTRIERLWNPASSVIQHLKVGMKCCSLSPKNSRESYNSNKDKGMFFSLSFELEDENDNKPPPVAPESIKEGLKLCWRQTSRQTVILLSRILPFSEYIIRRLSLRVSKIQMK